MEVDKRLQVQKRMVAAEDEDEDEVVDIGVGVGVGVIVGMFAMALVVADHRQIFGLTFYLSGRFLEKAIPS